MKKKSTQTNPSLGMEAPKAEIYAQSAAQRKTYQFTKFQDHSHGRQCKSPFGANHEPGIY